MFEEFRRAWRDAVENFWHELDADAAVAGGGKAVYRQVARARSQLDRLEAEIRDCRNRYSEERRQVEVCVRRQRLAERIGDHETVRVAAEYAVRHRERAEVLSLKLEALEAERSLCRRELDEMERTLQAAGTTPEAQLEDLDRHPADAEFRGLEEAARDRAAAERLEELKRRMGSS